MATDLAFARFWHTDCFKVSRSPNAYIPSSQRVLAMFSAIILFSVSMSFLGVVTSWTIRPMQVSNPY